MVDWEFYIDRFLGYTGRNGFSWKDVNSTAVFQTTLKYSVFASIFFKMTFTNECSYVQEDLQTMAHLESTASKGSINISPGALP